MPKIAMVAEPPERPMAGSLVKLAQILVELGNTRAYTLIRSHGNSWRVHFEGDRKASSVKMVDGKYKIIQD